ncbi:TatD family hydrolase [Cellvibrio sp. OA-2007]|uniref:TatD family hydrolase n=1 Tax=Cellvibrio sp. OA-2007 TaxID=529823 RepID=UPI0007854FC6|nr:TatD family hydrolase [Cellvibrio sp. OA-2007]
MRFFDSHCHFDFAEFNADRASLWHACRDLGVTHLVMPGVAPEQWHTAAQLCGQYEGLYYAVGIHPHWIEQQLWFARNAAGLLDMPMQEKIITLMHEALLQSYREGKTHCVAIGECGLDKRIATPMALQEQLLNIHIDMANQCDKPLIVHCVHAHNEMIALLKKNKPQAGGVIHGFSGSYDIAQQYVGLGFYLGVGGTITYERAQKTRAAVTKIPLEYLLLETDAPDMPLQGKQGRRNSPEYIPQVAQVLADLRGTSIDEIAVATSCNAMGLFHRS